MAAKRERHWVTTETLVEYQKLHKLSDTDMGEALGFSNSAISVWKQGDRMPKSIKLAIDSLSSRAKNEPKTVFMFSVDKEQLKTIKPIFAAFNISMSEVLFDLYYNSNQAI